MPTFADFAAVVLDHRGEDVGQRDLVSLGAACAFAHEPMPVARVETPADDFYVFDWDEAVAS